MNKWIVLGIVCLLVVSSVVFATVGKTNETKQASQTAVKTGCGSCNGGCTAEKNCGVATCGAVSGGKCTCGAA